MTVLNSLVHKTFYENCSHFILKWFQPNSFGEVCFLEKELRKYAKNSNFEGALYLTSGSMPLRKFFSVLLWFKIHLKYVLLVRKKKIVLYTLSVASGLVQVVIFLIGNLDFTEHWLMVSFHYSKLTYSYSACMEQFLILKQTYPKAYNFKTYLSKGL